MQLDKRLKLLEARIKINVEPAETELERWLADPVLSGELLVQMQATMQPYKERFNAVWQYRTSLSNRKDNDILLSGQSLDEEINGAIIKNNLFSIACQIHNNLEWYLRVGWLCLETGNYCFLKDLIETIEVKGW